MNNSSQYQVLEGDFKSFFAAPFNAYGDSPFVSLFEPDLKRFLSNKENPLFAKYGAATYFSVLKDGLAIGRLTAHLHRASNERHNLKWSYFGFFDCADDSHAAKLLLQKAEQWGRAQGATEIVGNMNLTAMQQIGVVTSGFENEPFSDQVYSPPHIARLLEENGYTAFFPVSTYAAEVQSFDPETLLVGKIKECFADPRFAVKTITRKGLAESLEATRMLLNAGFDQNPFFVPVSKEEFDFQAKDLMWVIDPRISHMAFYDGKPVGVGICIPDLNPLLKETGSRLSFKTLLAYIRYRLNRKNAVVIFYSIQPDMHSKGVAGAILYKMMRSLKDAGYERLGITWISDANIGSVKQTQRIGAQKYHNLHLFKKALQ